MNFFLVIAFFLKMGSCLTRNKLEDCTMENTEEFSMKGRRIKAKVIEVYDGDTVTLAFKFDSSFYRKRCRVKGVDCPEIRSKSEDEKNRAIQAKLFVRDLVLNKVVFAVFDSKEDKYGRLLADILVNDMKLSEIIIEKGHGYSYDGGKKKQ